MNILKIFYIYDAYELFWNFLSLFINIPRSSFNITLFIDSTEGLNSGQYYENIRAELKKNIDEYGLSKWIKIKDFSDIEKVENKEEAKAFQKQKRVDLIIWGKINAVNNKTGDEELITAELNFTYGVLEEKHDLIKGKMTSGIRGKINRREYWRIFENESYRNVKIISKNLFDISTYTTAVVFKLFGKIKKCTELFEKMHTKIKNTDNDFKNAGQFHLINCYQLSAIYFSSRKNYFLAKKFYEKILKVDPKNFAGLSGYAYHQYLTDDREGTEESVTKLIDLYPKSPTSHLNAAFFRILQKKYDSAYKEYDRLVKYTSHNLTFNPLEVVEFTTNQYKKIKDPALLYGSGILHYYYLDHQIAEKDLNEFLKRADKEKYNLMITNAKKILRKLIV